jgi:hypothetical protein
MNLIRGYERSLLVITSLFLPVLTATAQVGNVGTLEKWTEKPVSRDHSQGSEASYVKTVRTAKHKDFDRVVFEFAGPFPHYRIEYLKSNFYQGEADRVRIKSAGRSFAQVEFFVIPASDDQLKYTEAKNFLPAGPLRLPAMKSVTDMGLFEGFYDFVIGVGARKPFRVTELSHPSRLAVDFKH